MQCPADGTTLVMSERSGIEIDYCPQCRGVWLDRGELDKIIERSMSVPQPPAYQPEPSRPQPGYDAPRYDQQPYGQQYGRRDDDYGRRRKKESWLSDLFD
ncbi:hypothetical protein DY023_03170 [Microbacterium bovistercoris]|uniref:Transcription factor zinc-finger domain-containing protein n=1 Tax=Microbacterium bovistercoris TaxID=2293570 RepID=A0A371NWX1_9MICO|nr:zf-TFIIB domain-containing protein [Microbacterium bovistercoris]REJ07650.1 hypothetical protein DY023_03170 [Microbacterium bovistercoris]